MKSKCPAVEAVEKGLVWTFLTSWQSGGLDKAAALFAAVKKLGFKRQRDRNTARPPKKRRSFLQHFR